MKATFWTTMALWSLLTACIDVQDTQSSFDACYDEICDEFCRMQLKTDGECLPPKPPETSWACDCGEAEAE